MASTGRGEKITHAAERAAESRGFRNAARMGYVASGLLHVLIGVIALRIDFGGSGNADSSGAVAELGSKPGGLILLWVCLLGCICLALFQLSRIVFDARTRQGRDAWRIRGSAAGQAIVYAAVGASFGAFALGSGSNSGQSSASWSARLLAQPSGQLLLGAVGLGIFAAGGYFVFKGASRRFRRDLEPVPPGGWERAVTITGTAGFIAKGVSLAILGILVVAAAATASPEQSTGLDGALRTLREQPLGWLSLALVGAGLICYGLYTGILRARFAKL